MSVCEKCGSPTRIQVQAVVSAPGELAHQFSKQNLRRGDVYLEGVLWETADYICTNEKCGHVTNGYGNYISNLKRDYDAKCEELAANKAVAVALQRELAAVKAENEKFETFIKNLYVKSPTIAECLRTLGVIDEEGNSIPEQKP